VTPYSQLLSLSIQREFPGGLVFESAYVGRLARKLLIQDDLAMPLNLKDTASGMDYFTAAKQLAILIDKNTPIAQVPKIAFWENIFPALATGSLSATQGAYNVFKVYGADFTSGLFDIDVIGDPAFSKFGPFAFFNDQYSALAAWRSRAFSNYHGLELTLRKRFSEGSLFDFNYTFSKSIDIASATERTGAFTGFTVNAWEPGLRKAVSDFDTTHAINGNYIYELPFGRGRRFGSGAPSFADAFIGGWQLTGIFRWTSGLPVAPGNGRFWPTNWNITGNATSVGPKPETSTTRSLPLGPNMFSNPSEAIKAYRNTYPGDVGERNDLRGDGYFSIDMGLAKRWRLPVEGHSIQFRWEVFNVTNSVRFDVFQLSLDLGNANQFGTYSGTLTNSRVMQFALRYDF
jgi:hypothetical protein